MRKRKKFFAAEYIEYENKEFSFITGFTEHTRYSVDIDQMKGFRIGDYEIEFHLEDEIWVVGLPHSKEIYLNQRRTARETV